MNINEARKLACDLMAEHNLFKDDWFFNFDTAKRRFGACHYGLKRITLSQQLTELNDEAIVRNVILHEIAHALVGREVQAHGIEWKSKAIEIGCDGKRTYSYKAIQPMKRYAGKCPNCGRVVKRHKRVKIACGNCCKRFNDNRFDESYLFEWHDSVRVFNIKTGVKL